jgi:endonuclease/exonuclease/phosphatase family metal-dependent hydrolase
MNLLVKQSRIIFPAAAISFFLFLGIACEPLATGFEDTETAQYFEAKSITAVPDTFTRIRVMTWNIRFGAGRLPWFGDACGDRVLLTEEEVMSALQTIADKINQVKPDVLLLQEVDLNSKRSAYINQVQWILDHTYFNYAISGYQWKTQFIPSDGLGRLEETNATYSRWKISDAQRIELGLRQDQDQLTRYFYERCCLVTGKIEIPHQDNLYAVNIHASAFATDDTRQRQMTRFQKELGRISGMGGWFVAGGDLNTIPPGSDTVDYCFQDMCPGESFHQTGDEPMHKEGSFYDPGIHLLDTLYALYQPALPLEDFHLNQYKNFTHTTRGTHFWDRTLDYLFTNYHWVDHSVVTHQEATAESDHAPVSAYFILPD